MSEPTDDTVQLQGDTFARKFFAPPTLQSQIVVGAASHQGNVRPNNEDHYAVVKCRRLNEVLLTNLALSELALTDDSAFALVVADGIGGAKFGELASRLVVQRMLELLRQSSSWVMKYTDLQVQQIRERVDAYMHEIQATLQDYMFEDPALSGMGTTWTSAHLFPPYALVVHVGDSRAYVLTEGVLHQVTRDETLAQEFIDWGVAPQAVKKFRRALLNSLGGHAGEVTAQIHQLEIPPGSQLLLCTDGLTDMLADDEIANILKQFVTPQESCDRLVEAALDHGGKDNVTVVVASIGPEPS